MFIFPICPFHITYVYLVESFSKTSVWFLVRRRDTGGVGLPHLELYYRAVLLHKLVQSWSFQAVGHSWVEFITSTINLSSMAASNGAAAFLTANTPAFLAFICRDKAIASYSISLRPGPLTLILGNPVFPQGSAITVSYASNHHNQLLSYMQSPWRAWILWVSLALHLALDEETGFTISNYIHGMTCLGSWVCLTKMFTYPFQNIRNPPGSYISSLSLLYPRLGVRTRHYICWGIG